MMVRRAQETTEVPNAAVFRAGAVTAAVATAAEERVAGAVEAAEIATADG